MNESQLINSCLKKDKRAWDMFVQKYSRLIYWAIKKRFSGSNFSFNQDDVDCIFQETFLLILQGGKLFQLKDIKTISGWLAMIAANKTVDFMRKKIKEDKKLVVNMIEIKDEKSEQELYDRDILNLVSNFINVLPAKQKVVIFLNIVEGRTHREISKIINIPMNTVSTIIVRAKQKIKKEFNKIDLKDL